MKDNCDAIRKKITMFLATKEMTQTEFLQQIGGVNSSSFQRFMKLKGPYSGINNRTYEGASPFFHEREVAQKAAKADTKKRKRTVDDDAADTDYAAKKPATGESELNMNDDAVIEAIQAIRLPDENVYDDCDEIRRKISLLIQAPSMTQTRVCKLIGCNTNAVNKFLAKKGYNEGMIDDSYCFLLVLWSLILRIGAGHTNSSKNFGCIRKNRKTIVD
jgi:hypothetical protein